MNWSECCGCVVAFSAADLFAMFTSNCVDDSAKLFSSPQPSSPRHILTWRYIPSGCLQETYIEWWHCGQYFGLPITKSVVQFPLRTLICKLSSIYIDI